MKYKEDLDWLKGIGCYVWDTPELVMADRNKALYSEVRAKFFSYIHVYSKSTFCLFSTNRFIHLCCLQRLYKASFEKNRGNFRYTCDTPFFEAMRNASVLINDVSPSLLLPQIISSFFALK